MMTITAATAIVQAKESEKPFSIEDFNGKPFPDARESYFDLIGKIFSEEVGEEAKRTAIFRQSIKLRKFGEDGKTTLYTGPVKIESAEGWWFRAEGERHLALLIDIQSDFKSSDEAGFEQTILAVFSLRLRTIRGGGSLDDFELVEAVDPQTDLFTTFPDDLPLINENSENQFFWLLNHHHNAGENFQNFQVIGVVGSINRLNVAIEKMPGAYLSMDCSENTADFFTVKHTTQAAKNDLPYVFRLRSLLISKRECESESKRKMAIEETRIYRARRVSKKGRRSGAWQLFLISTTRRKRVAVRDKDY